MIAHTIKYAQESKIFDEVFVSTDSRLYADISVKYGASVPFLRSKALSLDTTSSWDVVREVLDDYEKIGKTFDSVSLLQPTSPLRNSFDILQGYNLFLKKNANVVISVCEVEHSPLLSNTLPSGNSIKNFVSKDLIGLPRQNMQKYFRVNGAIYICKSEYIRKTLDLYSDNCFAIIMPRKRSIDIDDEFDFNMAEFLIRIM